MLIKDPELKKQRGYIEPGSFVRLDGSEKLIGRDWQKRKHELIRRAVGSCELFAVLGKEHHAYCNGLGEEPHHIIPRSKHRDDRLQNLLYLSHWCHSAEDGRKIGGRK